MAKSLADREIESPESAGGDCMLHTSKVKNPADVTCSVTEAYEKIYEKMTTYVLKAKPGGQRPMSINFRCQPLYGHVVELYSLVE